MRIPPPPCPACNTPINQQCLEARWVGNAVKGRIACRCGVCGPWFKRTVAPNVDHYGLACMQWERLLFRQADLFTTTTSEKDTTNDQS